MRLMCPKSIRKVYIPATAKVISDHGKSPTPFLTAARDFETNLLLKGFERQQSLDNPKHKKARIPFTPDLVNKCEGLMASNQITKPTGKLLHAIEKLRLTTCQANGNAFMLRACEHIHSTDAAAKPPLRNEVIFFDSEGQLICYENVGKIRAHKVTFFTEFSKTDQTGRGRIASHIRLPKSSTSCIVRRLEKWYRISRDQWGALGSDPLYDLPRQNIVPVKLTLNLLHHVMTATTDLTHTVLNTVNNEFETVTKRVTSHSLRYGGATALAAAGIPEFLIALYGGWVPGSTSLKLYVGLTNQTIDTISHALTWASDNNISNAFIENHMVTSKKARRR